MHIDETVSPEELSGALDVFFNLAAHKIRSIQDSWKPENGAPVFTRKGLYTSRGWTEWTQGFQFGCQLLEYDATGRDEFYHLGRANTLDYMARHVSHIGVHDHGFNNISTYGNLRRLTLEERAAETGDALSYFELALKTSGAVQAARWTVTADSTGFIHSFNGPHSLFADTIRSCRILGLAHRLGHELMGEGDRRISLLGRLIEHALNTSRYNVYFGEKRDAYDTAPGRVAHESVFNTADGAYRCPSTQQGYSPFTTWTRGLAWIILGYAEQLEFLATCEDAELDPYGGREAIEQMMVTTARAASDFYIANTGLDGVPYWDTGAPGLARMPGWRHEPAEPDNPHEPVDSSAAAIAAQGLLRLGNYLGRRGSRYWFAGLTVARTLFSPRYLAENHQHQGLLLHSVYHRPKGWDYIPPGGITPRGESSMWGDYHAMELGVYLKRIIGNGPYLTFFMP